MSELIALFYTHSESKTIETQRVLFFRYKAKIVKWSCWFLLVSWMFSELLLFDFCAWLVRFSVNFMPWQSYAAFRIRTVWIFHIIYGLFYLLWESIIQNLMYVFFMCCGNQNAIIGNEICWSKEDRNGFMFDKRVKKWRKKISTEINISFTQS